MRAGFGYSSRLFQPGITRTKPQPCQAFFLTTGLDDNAFCAGSDSTKAVW